jgi:hypothetical protein
MDETISRDWVRLVVAEKKVRVQRAEWRSPRSWMYEVGQTSWEGRMKLYYGDWARLVAARNCPHLYYCSDTSQWTAPTNIEYFFGLPLTKECSKLHYITLKK